MEEIKTSFLLPRDLWKQARIRAAEEGISFGEIIRKALEGYLRKPSKAKQKAKT